MSETTPEEIEQWRKYLKEQPRYADDDIPMVDLITTLMVIGTIRDVLLRKERFDGAVLLSHAHKELVGLTEEVFRNREKEKEEK